MNDLRLIGRAALGLALLALLAGMLALHALHGERHARSLAGVNSVASSGIAVDTRDAHDSKVAHATTD